MEIIGTPAPRQQDENDDGCVNVAEMKRLGLGKQYKQIAVGHKDESIDDYPIYLCGEGTMMLNFDGGSIVLDRQEVCRLYTFFDLPHVKELMLPILRASLVEAGHEKLIDELMSMPDDHKQAVLWAFGRAEKPAFLDAPAAA